jgi:hypothetical protein
MELMSYPHVHIASNFRVIIMKYDKGIVKKKNLLAQMFGLHM